MRDRLAFSLILIALLLALPSIPSLIDLARRVHFHPHSSTEENSQDNAIVQNGSDDNVDTNLEFVRREIARRIPNYSVVNLENSLIGSKSAYVVWKIEDGKNCEVNRGEIHINDLLVFCLSFIPGTSDIRGVPLAKNRDTYTLFGTTEYELAGDIINFSDSTIFTVSRTAMSAADDVISSTDSSSPEARDMALGAKKREEERRQKQIAERERKRLKLKDEHYRELAKIDAIAKTEQAEVEKKRLKEMVERDLAKMDAFAKREQAEWEQRRASSRANDATEIERIKSQIRDKVKREWAWIGDNTKLEVKYRINLSPDGDIFDLQKIRASGDSSFDASVSQAILLAEPLPVPRDELLFRENFDPLVIRFTLDELDR